MGYIFMNRKSLRRKILIIRLVQTDMDKILLVRYALQIHQITRIFCMVGTR